MIQAISCCKDAERQKLIGATQPLLPPEEPDLRNDFISKEPNYFDGFCINCLQHYIFGHILSDSDPLDDVDSWKEVVRPTKKPRSVGPHKLKPKKVISKKKTNQKNKKSRSVTVLIPGSVSLHALAY